MKGSTVVGEIAPGTKPSPDAKAPPKKRPAADKPERALPTDRLAFKKQLELLRAYAIAAAQSDKPVALKELTKLTGWNIGTVSYSNPFFNEAGFITKVGNGYVPVPEVASFAKAWSFDAQKAGYRLAPVLRRAWFGKVLLPRLAMNRMPESEAITELAVDAKASTKFKPQLKTVIDYLECAGLVERDGGNLKPGPTAGSEESSKLDDPQQPPDSGSPSRAQTAPFVSTAFAHAPEGAIRFHVEVEIDLRELATWNPDVVSALFGGMAQVISAKAMMEKDSTKQGRQ